MTVIRDRPALAGIIPILAVGYDEADRVARNDLAAQVDHLATLDVTAIGIGFASDILRQTDAERDALVRAAADALQGRRPLMASVGGNSIRAAVDRATAAVAAGATILMVTPPGATSGPPGDDLVAYFGAVARAGGAPIVVQDAPGLTGTTMSADLLARIARDVEGVVALKVEALPPAPKVGAVATMAHGRAGVLGGAGGLDFHHELERGADGTVPGAGITELFVAVHRRHRAGDRAGARRLFNRYLPLLALASRSGDTFMAVQLHILRRRGIVAHTGLRSPWSHDPQLADEVDALLDDLAIEGRGWQPDAGSARTPPAAGA